MEIMPDALACLAASAALAVSDIHVQEVISEVRVARVEGKMIVNPYRSELAKGRYGFYYCCYCQKYYDGRRRVEGMY